ncbi:hypothetical protein V8V74_12585 [Niallia taxi]
MVYDGFLDGELDIECEERIREVWEDKDYLKYTKIINISNDKTTGTLSFMREDFYLQVLFKVTTLRIGTDLDSKENDYFDCYPYE